MPFTLTMPKLSPTMTEGVIAAWHKQVGDYVAAGDVIVDIATDKATLEYQAIDPGWIKERLCKQGEKLEVGKPLAIMTAEDNESIEGYIPCAETMAEEPSPTETTISFSPKKEPVSFLPQSGRRIIASPLAKRLARQKGISLEGMRGSGPRGRIMSRDLQSAPQRAQKTPSIDIIIPPGATYTPLSPMRTTIAERLSYAKTTIPHFYASIKVDVSEIFRLREKQKSTESKGSQSKGSQSIGSRITVNDYIIKAVATALMEFPQIRASFLADQNTLMHHPHADISVAVSVQGGLFTPIVFEAENKSLQEISDTVRGLAAKAKEGMLTPDEYMGGACTISNMGMYGIEEFYAIINPPQVAILSVGAAVETPVVRNGSIEVAKMMPISLAADHRAIDGSEGASFLKYVQQLLENPS